MTNIRPVYWKTDLETLEKAIQNSNRAQIEKIAISAGDRPIWSFCYGEKQEIISRANYNSACGAGDRKAYIDTEYKKPVVMLVGGIHGQETEGIAALMNLIQLLETGTDLAGRGNDTLLRAAERVRLVIIPIANPDGRARVVPDTIIGSKFKHLRYWGQGTWKDGSLCGWPGCKRIHPMKDAEGFLGGYFNDEGINLMHDQFFHPMAAETQAIIDLVINEYADCVLLLHGGGNLLNEFLQPAYVPIQINQKIYDLAERCNAAAKKEELAFHIREIPGKEQGEPPPSFNLTSALHHACGAMCAVFESNECIIDLSGPQLDYEQIYRSHMILFEQTFKYFSDLNNLKKK